MAPRDPFGTAHGERRSPLARLRALSPRKKAAAAAAALVVAAGGAVGLTQGVGGINVFVGSPTVPGGGGGGGVTCDATLNSGGNVATALTNAPNGGTVCLNAGTYSINATVTKTAMTKVTPAPGVAKSAVTMSNASLNQSQYIQIDGLTLGGFDMSAQGAVARHIRITNNTSGPGCVHTGINNAQADILIDGNTFLNISSGGCGADGRLSVVGDNVDHTGVSGITISNNIFGDGGCTDGVFLGNGDRGTVVGPGNEFRNLHQSPCPPNLHVDGSQTYGGRDATFTGNWFHNVTDAYLSSNGNGEGLIFSYNVVGPMDGEQSYATADCGNQSTYTHNTFVDTTARGQLYLCYSDVGGIGPTYGTIVRNNYLGAGFLWQGEAACTGTTTDHNMSSSTSGLCGGAGNVAGTPTWVGGASPTSYAGFMMTNASLGFNAGSDGTSIGIGP